MAATRSTLRGQDDVVIRNRQISDKVVLKAVGYKNRETLMEFFIKVHANPKISN